MKGTKSPKLAKIVPESMQMSTEQMKRCFTWRKASREKLVKMSSQQGQILQTWVAKGDGDRSSPTLLTLTPPPKVSFLGESRWAQLAQ